MKKIIALVIALASVFALAACQPTPDKDIVINKNDGVGLDGLIAATAQPAPLVNDALYARLGAPQHWNYETTTLNGRMHIVADVDILLPNVTALPAATAELVPFTNDDLENVAAALGLENARWTEMSMERTKEQYAVEIARLKEDIAWLEAENNPELATHMELVIGELAENERNYLTAPSESEIKRRDIALRLDENAPQYAPAFEGVAWTGGKPFYLTVQNYGSNNRTIAICANIGATPDHIGGTLYHEAYGVALTKEQAGERASAIAARLTDELTLCGVYPGVNFYGKKWGWICIFMREINGCPTAYESTEVGGDMESTVAEPIPYERMTIVMGDEGVMDFSWRSRMRLTSIDNTDLAILPFDEIAERAIQGISQWQAYSVTERFINGVDMSDPDGTVVITKVELGLMRVMKKNSKDYYYIPVWNFFTSFEHSDAFIARTGYSPLPPEEYINAYGWDAPPRAWGAVTINALDGSIIDRDKGY